MTMPSEYNFYVFPANAGIHEHRAWDVATAAALPDAEAMGPRFRADDTDCNLPRRFHYASTNAPSPRVG